MVRSSASRPTGGPIATRRNARRAGSPSPRSAFRCPESGLRRDESPESQAAAEHVEVPVKFWSKPRSRSCRRPARPAPPEGNGPPDEDEQAGRERHRVGHGDPHARPDRGRGAAELITSRDAGADPCARRRSCRRCRRVPVSIRGVAATQARTAAVSNNRSARTRGPGSSKMTAAASNNAMGPDTTPTSRRSSTTTPTSRPPPRGESDRRPG